MHTCYTFFSDKSPAMYVAQVPGDGGKDWGFTTDITQAKPLSEEMRRAFSKDQNYMGRQGYALLVSA